MSAAVAPLVIVVTGPVGAGKTTTVSALGDLLTGRGLRVWTVDQDHLRSLYPMADDDPYGVRLGLENLAACWPNITRRGVDVVAIADVVEHPREAEAYAQALGVERVTVVRLDVAGDEVARRLRGREEPHRLERHLRRAVELQQILEAHGVGDVVVRVDGQTPPEVARLVAEQVLDQEPRTML